MYFPSDINVGIKLSCVKLLPYGKRLTTIIQPSTPSPPDCRALPSATDLLA